MKERSEDFNRGYESIKYTYGGDKGISYGTNTLYADYLTDEQKYKEIRKGEGFQGDYVKYHEEIIKALKAEITEEWEREEYRGQRSKGEQRGIEAAANEEIKRQKKFIKDFKKLYAKFEK